MFRRLATRLFVVAAAAGTASRAMRTLGPLRAEERAGPATASDPPQQQQQQQQQQQAPPETNAATKQPVEEVETPEEAALHRARAAEFGYVIPEHECPMCTFIRKGPCYREYFTYDKCHRAAKERNASKEEETKECMPLFAAMYDCMKQNMEYYAPLVQYFEQSDEDETEGAATEKPAASSSDASGAEPLTAAPSGAAQPL